MAKTNKGSSTLLNVILAVVMIAVIGLSVYAVYTTMSEKIINEKIASGEIEKTLDRMAEDAAMSVDEFMTKYGLENAGLTKDSVESNVVKKMKLSGYAEYKQTTVDAILAETFLEGKATGDTLYEDFLKMFTVRSALGGDEEQFKQMKEMYELDDSITMDSLWSDVEPIISEKAAKMMEQQNAQAVADATEAPAEGTPATEAPAEDTPAEEAPATTEAPAEEKAEEPKTAE